jgi:signal transduction histidine kinase
MSDTVTHIVKRGADRVTGLTALAAPAAQPALDAALHDQRVELVRLYSLGIAGFGLAWCAAYLALAGGAAGVSDWSEVIVGVHAAVLGSAGCLAYRYCGAGMLRHATYTDAAALIFAASINLACIGNAEGAGVMTYFVAVSLLALVVESDEWLWWGGVLAVSALIAAVLHSFPPAPLIRLPPALAIASLIIAAPFGLAVPIALFALFSRNLTASREEGWALARQAAVAHRLAAERAAALEQRGAQLQAKHAELNDFLYVVSHDLRAPLINLEGFSGTLRAAVATLATRVAAAPPADWLELRADIDEALEFIVRSVRKMELLVQGLLELARIDSRPAVAERIDLDAVVREIVATLQYRIAARQIAVRLDPLPTVLADRLRMHQVFANLLDNAVKFMPGDGAATIHVGCVFGNAGAQFFVRDSGRGIRAEDHQKIFRLFSRVGDRTVPGEGIGLAAVKKIIEQLGGSIRVESALGRGSTFWFTLPTHEAVSGRETVHGSEATDRDSPR